MEFRCVNQLALNSAMTKYILYTNGWIDGRDAIDSILTYSENQQYTYGVEAGKILRKIHTIPATEVCEDWEIFFNLKIDDKISNEMIW
ncbi:hypothetical protein KK1157_05570 [Streptococcus pneumoniae]|nr:hypothetical protein KK0981_30100 [Streptococcus pneumoniae]BAX32920.1 hypothetical protein KK1157_05570 [Streptococcus pneumoniae]